MARVADFAARSNRPCHFTGLYWDVDTLPNAIGVWTSIAFGDGYFAGVSATGALNSCCQSTDGYNWQARNMPAALQYQAIDFGEHVFCAVAQNGAGNQFARSVDHGAAWAAIAEPANLQWQDLCYCGSGTWVAVAQNGVGNQFARSTDNGLTWGSIAEPVNLQWQCVAANPTTGTVIAIAQNGAGNQIARSTDRGATWGSLAEPVNTAWGAVCYGYNSLHTFVAVTPGGVTNMMYSADDGATWAANFISANTNHDIAFGAGRFITANSNNNVLIQPCSSRWGLDWTHTRQYVAGGATSVWNARAICYGLDRFVMLGDDLFMNVAIS